MAKLCDSIFLRKRNAIHNNRQVKRYAYRIKRFVFNYKKLKKKLLKKNQLQQQRQQPKPQSHFTHFIILILILCHTNQMKSASFTP